MKDAPLFDKVYKKGRKGHSAGFVLFYFDEPKVKKIGYVASKKVGNAVKRNKTKRRMRSLFFSVQNSLKEGLYIFVGKSDCPIMDYKILKNDFFNVLKRLQLIVEKG